MLYNSPHITHYYWRGWFQVKEKLGTLSREATEQNIEAAEQDLRVIREAAPKYDSYMRLTRTELPSLNEDIQKHNIRKEQLVDEYNKVGSIEFSIRN